MFRVVNLTTGETLFESNAKVSVGIFVDGHERAMIYANREKIASHLQDYMKDRPDIKPIRSRHGLSMRMEI